MIFKEAFKIMLIILERVGGNGDCQKFKAAFLAIEEIRKLWDG